MQEKILTPEQVAQILQIHQFTVLKYIKQGKLNASKIGRVYRIRESDLQEFLDRTSGKTSKGNNQVSNNKNKNKTTQNFPADQTEVNQQSSTIELDRHATPEPKIEPLKQVPDRENVPEESQKVSIEKIDNGDREPKEGGQDTYYILR